MEEKSKSIFLLLIGVNLGVVLSSNNIEYLFLALSSLIAIVYIVAKNLIKNLKWTSIDNSKTLYDASTFKITIIVATTAAAFFIALKLIPLLTIIDTDLTKILYETFRVPVIVFGVSIPVVALIASLHRSNQAFKQMEINHQQNTFTNYLKHKETFMNFTKENENLNFKKEINKNNNNIYNFIYHDSKEGHLNTCEFFNNTIKTYREVSNELSDKIRTIKAWDSPKNIVKHEMEDFIYSLDFDLKLNLISDTLPIDKPNEINNKLHDMDQALKDYVELINIFYFSKANDDLYRTRINLAKTRRFLRRLDA